MAQMKWNEGKMPRGVKGKRVRVVLRNGMRPEESWPADGPTGCDWALTGSDWDIRKYEIA